ncbi:hypothetical protein PAXINDRAFT_80411 [Paxillus involutus ATCC 200175]|uniref:T6SS Phospholipase effector Tle1-like catalytic domain-containing protein n=1 Tax=Paxillus involutus ATCC 200175 TaxID=664439 RepID=A0A0C9TU98_PAXIN|nr:hypothetical protein PAXINDRAFT_80411 [Paxillus involutus ATCC 200175]
MADTTPSPPSASAEKAKLTPFDLTIDGYAEIPTTSNSPSGDTPLPSTIIGSTADVVPPTHTHRTLVLCFDGTGDQFSEDNSNIVQFFSMLRKDDPSQQLVYYQAGIGTYTIPQIATPFMAKVSKAIDLMIGNHLDVHVMGGYEFLMQNYEAGDKICIFGFSRGAYTARALAGMVHKVGLLPRCNHQQVPFAYKMYTKEDETGWNQSTSFKKAFSINVDIEFVGVWDTVSSVGIIPRRLPFTKASDNIRYFRHAMSLDERRVRFKANYWNRPTKEDCELGVKRDEMPHSHKYIPKIHTKHGQTLPEFERQYSGTIAETDVEEVWFAGVHTDVGGGSVVNGTRNSLARIPLRWMIRQCFKTGTGILFQRSMFKQIGMDPNSLYPEVLERPPAIFQSPGAPSEPGSPNSYTRLVIPLPLVIQNDPTIVVYSDGGTFVSEEEEDLADALCPTYDQLKLALYWWILEVIPQKLHYQRSEDDEWAKDIVLNLGAGRHIPRQQNVNVGVKVHRSVKVRMEADGLKGGKYWPKANLHVEPQWVD